MIFNDNKKNREMFNLPIQIRMNAGSKAIFVIFDKLWKVSFSLHAHTPTVSIPNPNSCKNSNFRTKKNVNDTQKTNPK